MQTVTPIRKKTILFVCHANGSRSLMAEAYANSLRSGEVTAYSAGIAPQSSVSPIVFAELAANGIPAESLYPKSIARFRAATAPRLDYLITLCDTGEAHPNPDWPAAPDGCPPPVQASWTVPDPCRRIGSVRDQRERLAVSFQIIVKCVTMFLSMPDSMLAHVARNEPRGLDIDANTIALMSKSLRRLATA